MIRAHLHYDPDDKDSYARAFRLARLELAEHLAAEEGVPHRRMVAAGEDDGVYLVVEAEGPEGRQAFSGLLLALDGDGASQSLFFEFETAQERRYLESLPLYGAFVGRAGSLVPPLRPLREPGPEQEAITGDARYPVADVERATIGVLSRTPLLCALDPDARADIACEVRRGTARRLSEEHRERTTAPAMHGAVLESFKETTLFCVLIGSKLRLLADHVVEDVKGGGGNGMGGDPP